MTYFGTSAPFLLACRKEGLRPGAELDLTALRGVGSTGAPLPPEGFTWVYEAVGTGPQLQSLSGGTDVCTGFVGGVPLLPVRAGEISCRCLGARVEAFGPDGTPVSGELGELVITAPMPSMPVGFWNDPDGSRYREAYFDVYPGVWRHGDFFELAAAHTDHYKQLANWLMGDITGYMKDHKETIFETGLTPTHLAELVILLEDDVISSAIAKKILPEVMTGASPKTLVEAQGLAQVSDSTAIRAATPIST